MLYLWKKKKENSSDARNPQQVFQDQCSRKNCLEVATCLKVRNWQLSQARLGFQTCSAQQTSFSGNASGEEPACLCRRHKRQRFNSWVEKISWRRKWQPTLVFSPGEGHGQRSLVGYSPWSCKELDEIEPMCAHVHARAHTHTHTIASFIPTNYKT